MASHYCNYPSVAQFINALPPERLKYLKNGCFKDVIAMLVDEHSQDQGYTKKVEVGRFDPKTRELTLPCGTKIWLTSQNPNLLKLSSGPYQFKQHLLERDNGDLNEQIKYVNDLYKFDLSGYNTKCSVPFKNNNKKGSVKDLWAELASTTKQMSEAEFYIKFTLAFVSSFVAPISFIRVNLDILGDIIPFKRIDTLDWDGFSIDQLAAGVEELKERSLKYFKGCAYLIIRADKLVGRMEGVNSPPRCSNLLVHAGTNSGPFSDSTAVSNLESMSSPAMNDHELLIKELAERFVLLEGIKDLVKESPGPEVEQGYEARGVHRNENEGYQHTDIALPNEDAGRDGDEAAEPPVDASIDAGNVVIPAAQPLDQEGANNAPLDAGHVVAPVAQPPGDTMEEDQELSANQGGDNASIDAGNVVVPVAQPLVDIVEENQEGYEARGVHHSENEGYQHTDIALPNEDARRDGDEEPPVDRMEEDQEVSADPGGNNASVDAGNVVGPAAQPLDQEGANNAPLDAGHVVAPAAETPVDRMEEDQEVSADPGGNNASVDAGNVVGPAAQPLVDNAHVVAPAAHEDPSPKGRGHRLKIPSVKLNRAEYLLEHHSGWSPAFHTPDNGNKGCGRKKRPTRGGLKKRINS